MPAVSQQQQKLFGLALAVKRGEVARSEASDEVLNIVDSMSEKDIEDFASTSHEGLPKQVEARLRETLRELMREMAIEEAELPAAPIPSAIKAKLAQAIDKIKDTNLTYNQKLQVIGKVIDSLGVDKKELAKMSSKLKTTLESLNEDDPCWKDYEMIGMKKKDGKEVPNCVPKSESVNEVASRTAMEIGGLTGINKDAIQKFVDDNNLDIEKVFQFVKKGKLSDRMDMVSAIAGKPGNPIQKKMIKMFGESVTEGKKVFSVNPGIGKVKYSISSHDGVKKHKDGSDFFDIETFKNKVDLEKAIKNYTSKGFKMESVNEDTKKRFDVDFYKNSITNGTSHEEIIRGDKFSDVVSQATKVAKSKGMDYVEFYYKDAFIGSIAKKNNYTFKKGRYSDKSPLSVNEASYNFGKEEYTKKNLTPIQILDLAMAYANVSGKGTNMYGGKMENMIKVANDLAKLNGTKQMDAKSRGSQPALILFLLKNKLVTQEEYVKLYKNLIEKQISVVKALKNADPASRMVGGAAARQAHRDMKGEFEESVVNEDANMNKKVKMLLDKELNDLSKGRPNHQFAVMHILIGALRDANFSSEAKKVPSIFPRAEYSGDPQGKEDLIDMYEYEIGPKVANICKWDGGDIVKAIGFYTSMTIGRPVGEKVEKLVESINEEKYPNAVAEFNKELIKHPMVKKAAQFYKKSPAEIVKVLQQRLYSKGDKTGNTKEVWIDFKDTTSGIEIKHKMKFNESNESHDCGCGCGGVTEGGCGGSKVNESFTPDPRKVYGGTGAKEGMVLVKQDGFKKILDLSKKNPSNVFLVSDDNYTKFGPFYVKNGKVAKYTVANPNYDFERNKVGSVKVPSDVILKFKVVE